MIDHGVDIARRHQKPQTRLSKLQKLLIPVPVRLSEDGAAVAERLQRTGDDGTAKRGVIHISISQHIDKIDLFESLFKHLFPARR